MTTLINATISLIEHNPFRMAEQYPFNERKIETLKHSIEEVGLWEGVIARRAGRRYQLAFGHHRVKAAEELGLKKVPLIVRDLDDKQMLQFMGRENMEDYNADFLVMLNTWEAAVKFAAHTLQNSQPIEIAGILGWIDIDTRERRAMNHTAKACNSAHQLIEGGHNKHADFEGLTVFDVREMATRAMSRIEALERRAQEGKRTHKETKEAKKMVAKAVKKTADSARKGDILKREIANEVDANAYAYAQQSKRRNPLFDQFADAVCRNLEKMLESDATSEKLRSIVDAMDVITEDADWMAVDNVKFRLDQLKKRADAWSKEIATKQKVKPKGRSNVVAHPALPKGA